MKKLFISIFIFLFLTTACGFKVAQIENKYNIVEINTTGNTKINYLIRNRLLSNSNKNSNNLVTIDINTKLVKSIKDKDLQNEITKFEIKITSNVKYSNINNDFLKRFDISKVGYYNVAGRFSATRENENKLINKLVDELIDDTARNISVGTNDL
tara:strand:+ start:7232 stop:7696 length:465 start_codon:yes stop_codon:yes gene_type:complete